MCVGVRKFCSEIRLSVRAATGKWYTPTHGVNQVTYAFDPNIAGRHGNIVLFTIHVHPSASLRSCGIMIVRKHSIRLYDIW